ncbi:hypothetical protein AJ80_04554 [Polytolypa hystricis UAMH7299]|uniref:FAD-binding domain-containing protein n=1 Tax=Polytolypa hystricis (strain UAMH7299) TaxID=1447883 RepID=A0A2B7YC52_POLH7|nr:hypothetical protein AJ80_04554 [Polytolypa hystricis UAMH7299]
MEKPRFKVIIIGASISGLTLAHCLDRAGIDYVVLEKHHDIHPQLGAGICLLPNGVRILEQLGIYTAMESMFFTDRFGRSFSCLERRDLLKKLYTELRDKSRVHVASKVVGISTDEFGISVETEIGTVYHGNLAVGADGVHSIARSEMWRVAAIQEPGLITDKEKSMICAEFSGVFGVSNPIRGVKNWQSVTYYGEGLTILVLPLRENSVFWLVISKLDRKYVYPNIPRFSRGDARCICEPLASTSIWADVKFGDLWERRRAFNMSALEEYMFEVWHYGRIVCIGDSVSKIAPNSAQGASMAIEAAAGLSNMLRKLINGGKGLGKPSYLEINAMLHRFNRAQLQRLEDIHTDSHFLVRFQASNGLLARAYACMAPYPRDFMTDGIVRAVTGAMILDYIPLTGYSGKEWRPLTMGETLVRAKTYYRFVRLLSVTSIILVPVLLSWLVFLQFPI